MSSWVANAKAQAAYQNVTIQAGGGKLVSKTVWQIVVELRSPTDKVVMAIFDKTTGKWTIS